MGISTRKLWRSIYMGNNNSREVSSGNHPSKKLNRPIPDVSLQLQFGNSEELSFSIKMETRRKRRDDETVYGSTARRRTAHQTK
jgi:hypothetical protein